MKHRLLLLLLALLLPLSLALPAAAAPESVQSPEQRLDPEFLQGLNDFSTRFLAQALSEKDKNVCCSPVSLSIALSLSAVGAGGDTQAEMLTALGLPGRDAAWLSQQNAGLYQRLVREAEEYRPGVLRIANSLWLQKGAPFYQGYVDNAVQNYRAALFSVNFGDADAGSKIGEWISEHTGGLLNPVVELNPSTMMALINAVYLKDNWRTPFSIKDVKPEIFHAASGDVTCNFMSQTFSSHIYKRGEGYAASVIPLQSLGNLVLVLPDEGRAMESLLTDPAVATTLFDLSHGYPLGEFPRAEVTISIPKFDFQSDLPLPGILQQMGISKAFMSDQADFSGLSPQPSYLGDARHQAKVAIDESGIEAAAFTLLANFGTGGSPPTKFETLVLNRPFLFAVMSDDNVVLFSGAVRDPSK